MQVPVVTAIIASIALLVSIWTRIETYSLSRRQERIDRAKRVGEALIASQRLKNELSDCIDAVQKWKSNETATQSGLDSVLDGQLSKLEAEYTQIWDFVKGFEAILGIFERRENVGLDAASIEAKIAHFNQRRVMAEYDILYANNQTAGAIAAPRNDHS